MVKILENSGKSQLRKALILHNYINSIPNINTYTFNVAIGFLEKAFAGITLKRVISDHNMIQNFNL